MTTIISISYTKKNKIFGFYLYFYFYIIIFCYLKFLELYQVMILLRLILLVFYVALSQKLRIRSLNCVDSNVSKFESLSGYEDFIDNNNSSLKNEIARQSSVILASTIDFLKPLPRRFSHVASISPQYSGCAWLQIQHTGRASHINYIYIYIYIYNRNNVGCLININIFLFLR